MRKKTSNHFSITELCTVVSKLEHRKRLVQVRFGLLCFESKSPTGGFRGQTRLVPCAVMQWILYMKDKAELSGLNVMC